MAEEKKFALLVDVDNISPKYVSVMLNEAKSYGSVSVRRAYGDWTDRQKKTWKECLLEYSIIPIQQYSYTTGKNASDSSMIIDAMDILYTDNVDGFIIVSSDSDFTRLAMRLREAGKMVIGMGESKTPKAFVRSCEEFKVLDVLFQNTVDEEQSAAAEAAAAEEEDSSVETSPITKLSKIKRTIFDIIDKNSDEDDTMLLSELGRLLTRKYPDFDERNYGKYRKFSEFIRMIDGLEVVMVNSDDKQRTPIAYVRRQVKEAAPPQEASSGAGSSKRKKTRRHS
ncbi:MAG: NYN domain-containing protein [Clostridiales bacterium]|nr:NYN domain-containing protein [Clostridiales bacterium]